MLNSKSKFCRILKKPHIEEEEKPKKVTPPKHKVISTVPEWYDIIVPVKEFCIQCRGEHKSDQCTLYDNSYTTRVCDNCQKRGIIVFHDTKKCKGVDKVFQQKFDNYKIK